MVSKSSSMDKQGVFFPSPGSGSTPFWPGQAPTRLRPEGNMEKQLSPERAGLEIWPFIGPRGGQKRNREVKSVSTDPFGAATELLEPSCGRFRRKSAENKDFGLGKWSREAILVDGCGRSAYRAVELVERKTAVFASKKLQKPRMQDNPRIQDCHSQVDLSTRIQDWNCYPRRSALSGRQAAPQGPVVVACYFY